MAASVLSATGASTLPLIPCSGLKIATSFTSWRERQHVDRAPPVRIHSRLVRDQADALACEGVGVLAS